MLTFAHAAAALALLLPLVGPDASPTPSLSAEQPERADLPSAESLFEGYIEATGGMAAYQRQEDRTLEGTYTMMATEDTQILRVYQSAPNNFRVELEVPGIGTTVRCTNGTDAWGMDTSSEAFWLTGNDKTETIDNGLFMGEAAYKERYKSIVTDARVQLDGRDLYRVVYETTAGLTGAIFFDPETKLIAARQVGTNVVESNPVTVRVSDYQEFNGVLIPMRQTQRRVGAAVDLVQMQFRWVKTNTGDMPNFDPPASLRTSDEG